MSLYEKLVDLNEGPFDIIIDPSVGPMELQEIGISDRLKYNGRENFAYAQKIDLPALRGIIMDISDNLHITGSEPEVYDRMTEKVTRIDIQVTPLEQEMFWMTFWYDGGVGHVHRQEKMELFIRPHDEELPYRMEYDETKKKAWIYYLVNECKDREEFKRGMAMDQFNAFINEKNLLWLLEDVVGIRYDVWDFLEDINHRLLSLQKNG